MKLRLLALLLITGLVWAQGLPSYKDLEFPPLGQVEIPEPETHTLKNGMKLFLLENHELPLIGGFALVRTGNLFDPPDKIGLAGFTGQVLRSGGTKEKTGDEIDEQLENIAASVESSIGETSGSVGFNCLKENIDEVLAVYKELMTAPEFRADKLDLAKTRTRSMIARRNDDAGGIASREFAEIIYGRDNSYGWRMEYEHVDNIQREDLVAFHQRYFFPANVALAIQGDFDATQMKTKLEKLFADWTVTQEPAPPFPPVTAKPAPGINLAVKDDVNQTFFRLGHLGGLLNDEDYPALEVMADILGGGFSSRLFTKVRTEKGWAYNVGANWGANYNHPGVFRISGSTKSESTTDTLELIRQEIDRVRTEEVTGAELQSAKDKVLNSFVFAFDRPSKTLNRLVTYSYHNYPKDFIFQYQKAVAEVTKADVLRVAKRYLSPEDFAIVAVGKQSDFGRPLAELNLPVTPIDLTIPEPEQERAAADASTLAQGVELLKRAQQAMGGVDKLAAVTDLTQFTQVSLQGPQGAMQVKQENYWIAPDKFRQNQVLPFGKMSAYYDGEGGWLASPQGTQPMPPPVVEQVRAQLMRFLPGLLLSDRNEKRQVNLAGEGAIEITEEGGNSVRLHLDPDTGLPAKLSYQAAQMRGPAQDMVDTFSDWRAIGGIQMPFMAKVSRGGADYAESVVSETKINTGLSVAELSKQP